MIAGSHDGVEAASKHAKELGAKKVMALPVSGAFHTSYMSAARDRLREAIADADIRDAEIPVVSNVDALPHDRGRSGRRCSPPSSPARCAGSSACRRSPRSASPSSPSSAPAACSPAWPSAAS